jgi:hypothetical protein
MAMAGRKEDKELTKQIEKEKALNWLDWHDKLTSLVGIEGTTVLNKAGYNHVVKEFFEIYNKYGNSIKLDPNKIEFLNEIALKDEILDRGEFAALCVIIIEMAMFLEDAINQLREIDSRLVPLGERCANYIDAMGFKLEEFKK